MSTDAEPEDLDEVFADLWEQNERLEAECHYRSAHRIACEIQRRAKQEQRLTDYLRATFHRTNSHGALLDPAEGQAQAIELIALLESPERARLIQPNFQEAEYDQAVAWWTTCAYDNLAEATAMAQGYNSDGMHRCIGDGLQVCRRTQKLECITCFREYALDVYAAADDLDLALHHARSLATQPPRREDHDRRWVGAKDETRLLMLQGQVEAAQAAALRALRLADDYHSPLAARLRTLLLLESILLLQGQSGRYEALASVVLAESDTELGSLTPPPTGESIDHDLQVGLRDALRATCQGEHTQAITPLSHWDRVLTERRCLEEWLEVRLRLIAAHRLAGDEEKAAALGRQLESRAKEARDWLTLRRLARLLDHSETVSPIAAAGPLTTGPFAGIQSAKTQATDTEVASALPQAELEKEPKKTPLHDAFFQLAERFEAAENHPETLEAEYQALVDAVLSADPNSITDPTDAGRYIQLLSFVVVKGHRGAEAWRWGQSVAGRFLQHAGVNNVLGTLGNALRSAPDSDFAKQISKDRIEQLFRTSLDLDPEHSRNHARAAAFFLGEGDLDEAERCLARGFRLDRTSGFIALRLADIYDQTDRARDALWVLDTALREGCEDPQVAWAAAMSAHRLEQYEAMLTYLDKFQAAIPEQSWANYYRAIGLLEGNRPDEALAALDREEALAPENRLPREVLRACVHAQLDNVDMFRDHLRQVLAIPLVKVDYLTITGLASLFERLWKPAGMLPEDDPLKATLIERMLTAGLAPEQFFEDVRESGESVENVNFYRCIAHQPLDDDWPLFQGCLAGQEEWTSYQIAYGVLARDDEEAAQFVLNWQSQCYPQLPAVLASWELEGEGFRDRCGVVWQGARWHELTGEEAEPLEPEEDQ